MVISVRAVQPRKASAPMVTRFSALKVVSLVQSAKAELPSSVTVFGIEIAVSLVHPRKAEAPMVFKVLESFGIKGLSIKWPNDVYVFDKKICGILLEGCSTDNQLTDIIIGIGINVNQESFDGDFMTPPTSLFLEMGKKINLSKLKRKIYSQIKKDFKAIKIKSDYLEIARDNNYLKGKQVFAEINGEKVPIKVVDIAEDNSLIYDDNGQKKRVFSGEITFHI